MKTTLYRKSWATNLFLVSNFTFDSCFKGELGNYAEKVSYISLIIGSRGSKCENNLKVHGFKVFSKCPKNPVI